MDEEAIFIEALQKAPSGDHGKFLDEACAGDEDLRRNVEKLLRAHEKGTDFLKPPTLQRCEATAECTGNLIGRYKLLELIGEGGFGDVYMAEQTEPVRRKVALKIIKLGMDTRAVIARFEAERQALALMDHPNIAKVLDAGATETGRPYFVMDLVRGWPITEYCDANNLTTRERLRLFIDVCDAVQHAHQKGIIHRDIKPTNVMVTLRDTKPVSKIIDFGIAKATQQRLTEKTLFTEHRQLVGTPEYMSPEQATFGESDIDTRSDIYSLGVLLYELLVGTTPFDADALRGHGYDEICRLIRESEPPTPSKRLSTLGEVATDISKHRHAEPATLRKLLCGDLDWIVMKALEKDRGRRYESAHGLARDVERHLNDEPVHARPPSAAYRLKKYIRKHRVLVGAVAAVLIVLTIGYARTEYQRRIAIAERDRAEENWRLADDLMRDVVVPAAKRMEHFPFAQEHLHEITSQIRDFYERMRQRSPDDPELRRALAWIDYEIGRLNWVSRAGEPASRRSVLALQELVDEFPDNVDYQIALAESVAWLSLWYKIDLRFAEALAEQRKAHAIFVQLGSEFPTNELHCHGFADSNTSLGERLVGVGRLDKAEPYYRAAIQAADRGSWAYHRFRARQGYSHLLMRLARYDEAERLLDESQQIAEQEFAPRASPPRERWVNAIFCLAICRRMMGQLCLYTGKLGASERHCRQAVERVAPWADGSHAITPLRCVLGSCHHDLAEVLTLTRRLDEAEAARRKSIAAYEWDHSATAAMFPHNKSLAHYRLGELLHHTGRTVEATNEFTRALAMMEDLSRRRPHDSVSNWPLICLLANCPDPTLRDPSRAVGLVRQVMSPADGPYWRHLALAQYRSAEWQDAADSIRRSMDLRQGGDAYDWFLLAMADWQLGQKERALERYTEAQEAIEAGQPLFFRFIGVMAVDRLRREAESLLSERTSETENE